MKLNNHTVLITGGNKGIGLAMTKKFLELGNKVIVLGRNEVDLNAVKSDYPEVIVYPCDLSKSEELDKLVVYIENKHPDLNVLINNAGVQYNYNWLEERHIVELIENELTINTLVPVKLTSMLLPTLESNIESAVVNVSSALGFVPKESAVVYSASKSAIHTFSKALRGQNLKSKVFEIIPSLVDTAMTAGRGKGKISPDQLVEEFISKFERDVLEINIGKVRVLRSLNWLLPSLAHQLINK